MRVFNFCGQFMAAVNLEEATKEFESIFSPLPPPDMGVELTDEEMDTMMVAQLDEDDAPTGETITIRRQLECCSGEDGPAYLLCGEE